MTDVVPEAYELVEHELLTADDFRDFMFTNAVRFWGEVNPDFFKGTAVEKTAAGALAKPGGATAGRERLTPILRGTRRRPPPTAVARPRACPVVGAEWGR